MNEQDLRFKIYNSLLFHVNKKTRYIFFEVDSLNVLNFLICLEEEPTTDEKDMYYSMVSEVTGDYEDDIKTCVIFNIDNVEYDKINKLKHLVFAISD